MSAELVGVRVAASGGHTLYQVRLPDHTVVEARFSDVHRCHEALQKAGIDAPSPGGRLFMDGTDPKVVEDRRAAIATWLGACHAANVADHAAFKQLWATSAAISVAISDEHEVSSTRSSITTPTATGAMISTDSSQIQNGLSPRCVCIEGPMGEEGPEGQPAALGAHGNGVALVEQRGIDGADVQPDKELGALQFALPHAETLGASCEPHGELAATDPPQLSADRLLELERAVAMLHEGLDEMRSEARANEGLIHQQADVLHALWAAEAGERERLRVLVATEATERERLYALVATVAT
jgi:hypothetical protein